MKNTDLLIFDQNGYLLNNLTDGNTDTYRKIINTSELGTYNSTSLHIFQKVDPLTINLNATTDVIQYVNDNNIEFNSGNNICNITNIVKTNSNSSFNTKWIYGLNIDKIAPRGTSIAIVGLNDTNYNETTTGKTNYTVVLKTKANAILVQLGLSNNNNIPNFTFNNTTYIRTISCVKLIPTSTYNIFNNNNYLNRKFNILNTKLNNGNFNITEFVNNKTIKRTIINLSTAFTDLKINITYLTDRVNIYNGVININHTSNVNNKTIIFQDGVPGYLKVGDKIYLSNTNLTSLNLNEITITYINSVKKLVYFTITDLTTPSTNDNQILECDIYLNTNTMYLNYSSYNNNENVYSGSITAALITEQLNNIIDTNIVKCYNDGNNIIIETKYEGNYLNIISYLDNNLMSNSVTNINNTVLCFDNLVNETTNKLINKLPEKILLNTSQQLIIEINGTKFIGTDDVSTNDIITNFYNTNSTTLLNNYNITTVKNGNTLSFDIIDKTPNDVPAIKILSNNASYFRNKLTINNIKNMLSININNIVYDVNYTNNSILDTVTLWFNTFKTKLELLNITVIQNSNILEFFTKNRYSIFELNVNISDSNIIHNYYYLNESIDNYNTPIIINSYDLIVDKNPLLENICIGQTVSISGINNIYNKKYIISNLKNNAISLSYQGNFPILVNANITISTDTHLRYPYTIDEDEYLKATITNGFFVDLDGNQAVLQQTIPYTGSLPISSYIDKFILVTEENKNISDSNNPIKQKNVYDNLILEIPTVINDNNTPSNPINLHIGILPETEEYINTEINIYSAKNNIITINTDVYNNNLVTFKDNKILISNIFNLDLSKLKIGDTYKISFTENDNNNCILHNNNTVFTILSISGGSIITDTNFIDEYSLKTINKTTFPYIDDDGNTLTENKALNIIFTYQNKLIKKINLLSEVNIEDNRFNIKLKNIGRNISAQDLNILKNYNNDEYNIKWSVLNNKRKELIEIHPDIFDITSTYKALQTSLNFWGYRDLKLFEYFINNNINSYTFGNLKPVEKNGFTSEYIWPNDNKTNNLVKTNKISLGYRITDLDGNYLESIDLATLQSKLFKLKQWLTDNVIATANLTDISGMSSGKSKLYLSKQSSISTGLISNIKSSILEFNVAAYNNGILSMPNAYNLIITIKPNNLIKEYDIMYSTFNVNTWNSTDLYYQDDIVKYNNIFWAANYNNKNAIPNNNKSEWRIIKKPYFNFKQQNTITANNFNDINIQVNTDLENMIIITSRAFVDGKTSINYKMFDITSNSWII